MRAPAIDYRKLRLHNINTPEFRHLFLLLGWVGYFVLYFLTENLIPAELTAKQTAIVYASEADVLNMALFGMTAREWSEQHPDLKGNMRDYADIAQLICLANLESLNAVLIEEKLSQPQRLARLNQVAIKQMRILTEEKNSKLLENK